MGTRKKPRYTAQPWRDLGHAKWHDPLAALENPKSQAFQAAVKTEDTAWSQALQHIPPPRLKYWRKAMATYNEAAHPIGRKYAEVRFVWQGHAVALQRGAAGYTTHLWMDGWHLDRAWSAVGFGEAHFYTLEDIGKGAEHLELTVWTWVPNTKAPKVLWRRDPVGPSVEIVGDRIYFSTVENLLRYPDIWVAPVATGHGAKCVFVEPDKRYQVTFMERDGALFVHKANALDQMLGVVDCVGESVRWIADEKSTLVPIGIGWYGMNDALVFYEMGEPFEHIALPVDEHLVDACLGPHRSVLVVTTNKGCESLWIWNHLQNSKWECLRKGDSGIVNSIHIFHDPTSFPTFLFRDPRRPDEVWEYLGGPRHKWRKLLEYPEPLRLRHWGSGQAGSAKVPYTWVSTVSKPRALLVEAYGAYGISARRAYPERWLPYLAAGWAIAYVCPRGGREDGDAWYDGGRTAARKAATFEDTAAAIQALQKSLHVAPAATVFFGRSAGGWLAANIAQAHGHLVAAVYAEVPYVDVLRTTSNPRLPLTQLEYDEFGDPRKVAEYKALRKISPVDTVPMCGDRCPLMVIRTALHDKQVLPYEALKWSATLRAAGWDRVYVGIDHDGGHFAAAKSMVAQRAEDAALLESSLTDAPQGTRTAITLRKKSVKRDRRAGTAGRTRRAR